MHTTVPAPHTIMLPLPKGRICVPFSEIIRLEGCRNYTKFVLADGQRLLTSKTISYYDNILPSTFLKVHKRCFVNIKFTYKPNLYKVERVYLKDGFSIEVSRRKKPLIKAFVSQRLHSEWCQ